MAKIYPINSSIDTMQDVKDQFIRFDRNYYPDEVYQFILDTLNEQAECTSEPVELDVIAWACDLTKSTITDPEFCDRDGTLMYETADELADDFISYHTTVICTDGDSVWHLTY